MCCDAKRANSVSITLLKPTFACREGSTNIATGVYLWGVRLWAISIFFFILSCIFLMFYNKHGTLL